MTARSIELRIDTAQHGSLTFDAVEDGPTDGPLVLLLHGFPRDKREWRHVWPALGAAGYRAVAVDQRGYSSRARPSGVDAYDLHNLVDDAIGFADALDAERFHVVGHDFGAVVTWQLLGRRPERVLTATVLSVGHPFAYLDACTQPDGDQLQKSSYFDWFRSPDSSDTFVADDCAFLRRVYENAALPDDEVPHALRVLGSRPAIDAALNWYRAATPRMFDGFGVIDTPLLYLWGTDDPALGSAQAEFTERYVSGPYVFEALAGIDHWIPEKAASRTVERLLTHLSR